MYGIFRTENKLKNPEQSCAKGKVFNGPHANLAKLFKESLPKLYEKFKS